LITTGKREPINTQNTNSARVSQRARKPYDTTTRARGEIHDNSNQRIQCDKKKQKTGSENRVLNGYGE
jgi:hypothetical protein